jgi:5'-3' exoribonuclease 2
MGIPYYFYSLTKKYQNILYNIKPKNTDIYCIDFNGIIHNIAQQVMKKSMTADTNIEEQILEGIWKKIEEYIDIYKAKKYIICADGVAPMAKIIQQRKRRYLTIYRNKIDSEHITKPPWDTNAITPGTQFMNNMNTFINNKIRYSTYDIEIQYSGSNECGEGEHKIFRNLKTVKDTSDIIINGLDADLIILSLMSHIKNIHLMRETVDKFTNENVYNYLNIDNLRKAILTELKIIWNLKDDYNENDVIESYCTLCSILGNDFIPHLLTVNIKTDGTDKLVNIAKKAIRETGLLVANNSINYECLKYIFKYLSVTEDADIFNICEKYIKKSSFVNSQLPSDNYAIKHKSPLCYTIYNSNSNWHKEYYKIIFDNNITLDSSVIYNSCKNYITGIYWVYEYYKGNSIDWEWYYPYNYPPTLKDISNHSIAYESPVIHANNNFIDPVIQLLIVLPRESMELVNNRYRSYVTDIHNGLYHMYPINYEIQTFLKTHLWECSPILPLINIKYIKKILHI